MAKKKAQDSLFRSIFKDRVRLLELYNAINNEDFFYSDPQAIELIDPDYYSSLAVRNEIAFIIDNRLIIIENQMSIDADAPSRMFSYFSNIYEEMLNGRLGAKYKEHALEIAENSEFYVLYSGKEDYPAESTLAIPNMSKTNSRNADESCLALNMKVLNINKGYNPK